MRAPLPPLLCALALIAIALATAQPLIVAAALIGSLALYGAAPPPHRLMLRVALVSGLFIAIINPFVAVEGDHVLLADELAGSVVIELRRRLVKQQHGWFWSEHCSERDSLALASRQLVDAATNQMLCAHATKRTARCGQNLIRSHAVALEAKSHVAKRLGHHHLGLGVLEQEARLLCDAGWLNGAQIKLCDSSTPACLTAMKGWSQSGEYPQERRLATARRAFEQDNLACRNTQRHIRERPWCVRGVAEKEPVGDDRGHRDDRSTAAATRLVHSVPTASPIANGVKIGPAVG